MTPAENWQLTDSFANRFNRLDARPRRPAAQRRARLGQTASRTGRMYQTLLLQDGAVATWPEVHGAAVTP